MKKILRGGLILAVIGGLAFGGYWLYTFKLANPVAAASGTFNQVVPVKQGSLASNITVVGQLASTQSQTLAFSKMTGPQKLATLAVKAGSLVTKGQVLATIDPASYQQAVDQARSDLQAAKKTLADLQTPATPLEIAQADVAVAKAQQQVEQATSDLADLKAPDLTSLQSAVRDPQDALTQLDLSVQLAQHDSLGKSERDLLYNVDWYQRRISELQTLVAQHQANLEQTNELADRQTTLAQLQANLAHVQAERQLAIKAKEAEKAKDQVTLADAQVALAEAQAGGDKLALAKVDLAVQDAQVSLQAAQTARTTLDAGADATDLAKAQAAVDKKRLALADAQAALDATQLSAPFAGTILQTNAQVGDQLSAASPVLSLANLESLEVLASVDETTIRRIQTSQSAEITFDAFLGQTFAGSVLAVPLDGALQNGVMVYQVPLSLAGADQLTLLVGMTANLKIQVAQAENALLVPTMALQQANGGYQVLVPNSADPNASPISVPVAVGLSDGTYTQITQGLRAGDQVLVQLTASTSSSTSSNSRNNAGALGGLISAGGPPPGG